MQQFFQVIFYKNIILHCGFIQNYIQTYPVISHDTKSHTSIYNQMPTRYYILTFLHHFQSFFIQLQKSTHTNYKCYTKSEIRCPLWQPLDWSRSGLRGSFPISACYIRKNQRYQAQKPLKVKGDHLNARALLKSPVTCLKESTLTIREWQRASFSNFTKADIPLEWYNHVVFVFCFPVL